MYSYIIRRISKGRRSSGEADKPQPVSQSVDILREILDVFCVACRYVVTVLLDAYNFSQLQLQLQLFMVLHERPCFEFDRECLKLSLSVYQPRSSSQDNDNPVQHRESGQILGESQPRCGRDATFGRATAATRRGNPSWCAYQSVGQNNSDTMMTMMQVPMAPCFDK